MPQVGIFGNCQECYGVAPTFSGLTLTNTGRNLKTWWYFEDFIKYTPTYGSVWQSAAVGAGASAATGTGSSTRPGIGIVQTGTTAAGYAAFLADDAPFVLGGGIYTFECECLLPILSTAIEEFFCIVGFGDTFNADQVDGVYFRYDRAVLGTNWFICGANNSVRTATDSGIAADTNYHKFKIVVNAAGTSAEFFIDDVSVGTVIANLPGAGRAFGGLIDICKTVGITSRMFYTDWAWLHVDLAVSR